MARALHRKSDVATTLSSTVITPIYATQVRCEVISLRIATLASVVDFFGFGLLQKLLRDFTNGDIVATIDVFL